MKKIAVLATAFFPHSHADVILSRWRQPFETDALWGWHPSGECQIASLFVEQRAPEDLAGKKDISADFATANDVHLAQSLEEALTLGGEYLAVDAVFLIGEHGNYLLNALGQKLYPRKEWFDRVVKIFRRSNRSVPLFCDKHLSWNAAWAQEMVETAAAMNFPLMAGSTLPLCRLDPSVCLEASNLILQALAIFHGSEEIYGFHSIELLQHVLGKHNGRVVSATAWRGRDVERGLAGVLPSLIEAALSLDRNFSPESPHNWRTEPEESQSLFTFEHENGFLSHHLRLAGNRRDFIAAVQSEGEERPRAGRAVMGDADSFYGHFCALNAALERLCLSGRAPEPPDRVLLSTRMIATVMRALQQPGVSVSLASNQL